MKKVRHIDATFVAYCYRRYIVKCFLAASASTCKKPALRFRETRGKFVGVDKIAPSLSPGVRPILHKDYTWPRNVAAIWKDWPDADELFCYLLPETAA